MEAEFFAPRFARANATLDLRKGPRFHDTVKSFRKNDDETTAALSAVDDAADALEVPTPTACAVCECVVLPVTVFCTGGYTGNYRLANGLSNGCTPVERGTIDANTGTGSSVVVTGAAFISGETYSSVEAQAVDGAGKLVFSGHVQLNSGPLTATAELTVTFDDCVEWLENGAVFQGGGAWCDNQMGETPEALNGFTDEQLATLTEGIATLRAALADFHEQYEARRLWRPVRRSFWGNVLP